MSPAEASVDRKSRLVVTGGSGFIGAALVEALASAGYQVSAPGRAEGVDLDRPQYYKPFLETADTVVHLAAHNPPRLSADSSDEEAFRRINIEGTAALAHLSRLSGVRRFIFISSARVYGISEAQPYGEDATLLAEDSYGRSKAEAEAQLARVFADDPKSLVILRLPVVYAPGRGGVLRLIARFARNGWPLLSGFLGSEKSTLYLGNLIAAMERLLDRPDMHGTFNLTDGASIRFRDFARAVATENGRRLITVPMASEFVSALPRIGPAARHLAAPCVLDDSRFRTAAGWAPPTPPLEALLKSYGKASSEG